MSEKRTWNTLARQPWNPIILHMVKAIDSHNELYLQTGNHWHLEKANEIRKYILELKRWIKSQEPK